MGEVADLDNDALGLVLEVEGLGEEVNIGLGARVDRVEGVADGDETGSGAHIDNDALLLLGHAGEDDLGELGKGNHVDVDELVDGRVVKLVKVLGVVITDAHIVDLISK